MAETALANPRIQASIDQEHELMPDSRCTYIHKHQIAEPFYTLQEVELIRTGGWPLPYPRPRGFNGLYQLADAPS